LSGNVERLYHSIRTKLGGELIERFAPPSRQHYMHAGARQRLRSCEADPTSCAGDPRDLVLQVPHLYTPRPQFGVRTNLAQIEFPCTSVVRFSVVSPWAGNAAI
jgi:hypothetical protein